MSLAPSSEHPDRLYDRNHSRYGDWTEDTTIQAPLGVWRPEPDFPGRQHIAAEWNLRGPPSAEIPRWHSGTPD